MPGALLLWTFWLVLAAEPPAIERLAWLSGCWRSEGGEPGSGEQWTSPAGGTLFGMSRTVRNGKTVAHEFMRIEETGSGSLVFVAAPSGQDGNTFELESIGGHEVTFADPAHDFPQRVIYRLLEPGRLLGRIEGVINGQFRAIDFPMAREPCGE